VGSAYKVYSTDTRARDAQRLFAAAATGATSPARVRQGQSSELITANPKNRRKVLEDAAGIGGLYQRRHEAELKLKSAEANLLRVDDVIEQLAQQLGQLARQAKQAARYRAIGEDLRKSEGLLLYRRWKEADDARDLAEAALKEMMENAHKAEGLARIAVDQRAGFESALPPLREEEAIASAILQRLSVQRDSLTDQERQAQDRIKTLANRIEQLTRDIEREAGLNRDAGETIEQLEWEARELAKASEGHEDRLEEATETASDAASILHERETDLAQVTEDVARLAARHQSAQRFVMDCRRTLERSEEQAAKARDAVDAAAEVLDTGRDAVDEAQDRQDAAQEMADRAEAVLAEAEQQRAETQSRESDARAERSEAEGEMSALSAEVSALARLLERDGAEGGQIMDRLQVEQGFEKALGAALSDDLRAPEVASDGPTGWAVLPAYDADQPLPAGVTSLAQHVSVPQVLERRMSQIGLVDAESGPRLQPQLRPGQRLVTLDGDLWRWDGFRAWAEDQPSAAAMRLEQLNRLEALKQETAQASARLDGMRAAHEALLARLSDLTRADKDARDARRQADQALTKATRDLSRVEAELSLAEGKVESTRLAVKRHEDDAATARLQVIEAERAQAELDSLDDARALADDLKLTVEAARMTMMAKRSALDEIRREGDARKGRAQQVTKELSGWRHRLDTAKRHAADLSDRKEATAEELEEAALVPEELMEKREELGEQIEEAHARRDSATEKLMEAETTLRDAITAEREAERLAGEAREQRAIATARTDAARETIKIAAARIYEELECPPLALLERLDIQPDQMPPSAQVEADVARLKRQRDALGAVNLRAEEDAREVQTEHDDLLTEKTDLEEAIKTLRNGIFSLNREGRERLLSAFEQVNANFSMLFTHLFGGGEANLMMVESDDPLEAGLEIMCQPPGKKLSTLSLLSGGEQTLTARALIFAVFLANPSPICVLDEVDAPLDDANVTRFCDMLDEMCKQTDTRFLIITHHAVTMARMDRLFGVTMQEQGVSQLVSVDLKKAEAMVA
jgi:chromosome segregation protein